MILYFLENRDITEIALNTQYLIYCKSHKAKTILILEI